MADVGGGSVSRAPTERIPLKDWWPEGCVVIRGAGRLGGGGNGGIGAGAGRDDAVGAPAKDDTTGDDAPGCIGGTTADVTGGEEESDRAAAALLNPTIECLLEPFRVKIQGQPKMKRTNSLSLPLEHLPASSSSNSHYSTSYSSSS